MQLTDNQVHRLVTVMQAYQLQKQAVKLFLAGQRDLAFGYSNRAENLLNTLTEKRKNNEY